MLSAGGGQEVRNRGLRRKSDGEYPFGDLAVIVIVAVPYNFHGALWVALVEDVNPGADGAIIINISA